MGVIATVRVLLELRLPIKIPFPHPYIYKVLCISVRSVMLPEATTNQLIAARHLFYLAEQNIKSEQTASLFAGVNLLQDAVEAFLWAAATYKSVSSPARAEIHQLFDAVSASLSRHALPFRHAVMQLNRLRTIQSTLEFIQIEKNRNDC
jgi:hypothetical protein